MNYEQLYWDFFKEMHEKEHSFKEREILFAVWQLMKHLKGREPGDGLSLYEIGGNIKKLDDFSYSEEQLNYVVHANFPRGDWDVLPWEKPVDTEGERAMYRSQEEANSTKAYMDTFNRPSIARYL